VHSFSDKPRKELLWLCWDVLYTAVVLADSCVVVVIGCWGEFYTLESCWVVCFAGVVYIV